MEKRAGSGRVRGLLCSPRSFLAGNPERVFGEDGAQVSAGQSGLLGAEETHTPVTPRWLCSTLIVGDQPGSSASRREHA